MTIISNTTTMAAVSDSEIRQMKKFMSESHFTYTDEWLYACMDWIKENNRSINFEIWKRELSEQWKDANLEEMESSCLPKNLSNQRIVKLSGKYGLQVNSIRDIGESSYSQWTKLKKLENENVSVAATDSTEYKPTWEPTPKRCMYLTMTDGTQQVFGLEMQPILGLKINMNPGFKVIIIGPVDCRRGVVHLKPNNIKIIGGEVESLLVSNRAEKILADTLKLTPSQLSAAQITQNSSTSGRSRNAAITASNQEITGDFPDTTEDPFPDDEVDDDIFMEIDEEALLRSTSNRNGEPVSKSVSAPARSISQMTTQKIHDSSSRITPARTEFKSAKSALNSKNGNGNKTKQKNIMEFMRPMPVIIDPPTPERQAIKRRRKSEEQTQLISSTINLHPKVPAVIKEEPLASGILTDVEMGNVSNQNAEPNDVHSDDDHDFLGQTSSSPDESLLRIVDETLESKLSESDSFCEPSSSKDASNKISVPKAYPVNVSESPFVYLAQVKLAMLELIKKRKIVHVKACVSTVVSNIQVDSGSWTLCVCINDGTDFLNCKISADILTSIIGFTPAEMKKMKATKTKEAKQKIAQGMSNLAKELVHLNAVFAVEIGQQPMITSITDLKLQHSAALKSRLFKL